VPRKQKRLPVVLSGTEITALLGAITSLKYRMILMTMYASGLRISEACSLRPEDIDSDMMVIRVRGKGDKERFTLLSKRQLLELRNYWRKTRPPKGWMFPGDLRAGPLTPRSVSKVFHKAVQDAGITKHVSPHVLRHSFATHLISAGTDVTVVQALLGHASLRTTEIYTHTSLKQIAQTKSPLDLLGTPDGTVLG
jgi:site-specific recombinase XerD